MPPSGVPDSLAIRTSASPLRVGAWLGVGGSGAADPPGAGPFKEFLQNADDAGATRFAAVFDSRQWGPFSLRRVVRSLLR